MLKNLDIELMRIIACFFVIFNHTGRDGFFLFSLQEKQSIEFWLYLLVSIFCKFSVPLFFAISGALLLQREPEPLSILWRKRVLKIFLLLIVWSFIYYLIEVYLGRQKLGIDIFFYRFYTTNWNDALWYLYAYIPMLMALSLLQRLVKSLTNKEFLYMFALVFAFSSLLPTYQYLLWHGKINLYHHFRLNWLSSAIVIYPCLGYFLYMRLKKFWNGKRLLILWIINIAAICLSAYLTYMKADITGVLRESKSQDFHGTFVLLNCAAIFVSCQYLCQKHRFCEFAKKVIYSMGGCVFGIYLLHVWLKRTIKGEFYNLVLEQWELNPMFTAFLFCATVFLLGYVATMALKKIPYVRRLVM